MRLICPKCDAQYEVAEHVIPEEGRDVQCSSCGHIWFQESAAVDGPDDGQAESPLPGAEAAPGPEPWAEPEPAAAPVEVENTVVPVASPVEDESATAPAEDDEHAPPVTDEEPPDDEPPDDESGPEPEEADYAAPDRDEDEHQDEAAPAIVPRRPPLDDTVRDILIQEAARETRARRAEKNTGFRRHPAPASDRPARPPAAPDAEQPAQTLLPPKAALSDTPPPVAAPVSEEKETDTRSDLLPDIEEIKSSLHATSERDDLSARLRGARPARSNFRAGFLLMALVFGVGVAVHATAPRLGAMVPSAKPALESYVETVGRAQVGLYAALSAAEESISGFLEGR